MKLSLVQRVLKPEYVFRPRQILRRLQLAASGRRGSVAQGTELKEIRLPWGHHILINEQETIGRAIATLGVYELVASEVLWRLIEPGMTVIDAGANIGAMTSLMSRRAGAKGAVYSFEPHPQIFRKLQSNTKRWEDAETAAIHLIDKALSSETGKVALHVPKDFAGNEGVAYVDSSQTSQELSSEESSDHETHWIEASTLAVELDMLLSDEAKEPESVLMKVDVEGHEHALFEGAGRWLKQQKIRDVLFEEHGNYPTPAMSFLEDCGYELFYLRRSFWRPELISVKESSPHPGTGWEPVNVLATVDSARTRALLRRRGWQLLKS